MFSETSSVGTSARHPKRSGVGVADGLRACCGFPARRIRAATDAESLADRKHDADARRST
jgi:hypothetical protein